MDSVEIAELLVAAHGQHMLDLMSRHSLVALTGAPGSGKTSLARQLAEKQPHRGADRVPGVRWIYLDLLSEDLDTSPGFWTNLGTAFGDSSLFAEVAELTHLVSSDPKLHEALDLCTLLAPGDDRIVLVLDNWDDARHNGGTSRVHVQSVRTLINAISVRVDGMGRTDLSCMIMTRFPSTAMLVKWARSVQDTSPGVYRLSEEINRLFVASPMPFLSRTDSVKVVRSLGPAHAVANQVADYVGGWLEVLVFAAQLVNQRGALDEDAKADVGGFTFEKLCDPLLRWMDQRPEVRALVRNSDPRDANQILLDQLIWDLRSDRPLATMYSIPLDFSSTKVPWLASPAVRANVYRPRFLIVDSENLVGRFLSSAGNSRQDNQCVFDALRASGIDRAIEEVAEHLEVPRENVAIACRDEGRLLQIFGTVRSNWQLLHTSLSGRALATKRTKSVVLQDGTKFVLPDNSDDTAAAVWAAQQVTQYPHARIYILGADKDHVGNLGNFGRLGTREQGEFTLCLPWDSAKTANVTVDAAHERGWAVMENVMTVAEHKIPDTRAALLAASPRAMRQA